ncbi:hypothetical protein [Pseudomonas sp. MWU12-2323]|uniref:hypothetical protein n=1 Tax=Pseudomonas sp. MWU12-2323 TaxID=2651296 RepID=UPI00128B261D|nr:hypothetical protein [Pseudomonas sp. MWU12-2323]MPQ72313.1 hypothetical protein [Pseudomonas sp. MWU12-2323]
MPGPYTAPDSPHPLATQRAADFRRVTGSVARERRQLPFLETPPAQSADYVADRLAQNALRPLLLQGGSVAGWRDILPHPRAIHCHPLPSTAIAARAWAVGSWKALWNWPPSAAAAA